MPQQIEFTWAVMVIGDEELTPGVSAWMVRPGYRTVPHGPTLRLVRRHDRAELGTAHFDEVHVAAADVLAGMYEDRLNDRDRAVLAELGSSTATVVCYQVDTLNEGRT